MVRPPASRRVMMLLGLSSMLILGAVVVLHGLNIRVGEGSFAYRYSPLYGFRAIRSFACLPIAALAVASVWVLATFPQRRRVGVGLLAATVVSLVAWSWWAPPQPVLQHTFNFHSPSHDGAFVLEALSGKGPREYLAGFDARLQRTPEQMRGTRVLSNPPGMTLLSMAALRILPPNPDDPWPLDRWLLSTPPGVLNTVNWPTALRAALLALGMWGASAAFAYLVGREFLSAPAAAVFMLVVLFNPSTVLFTPGKDPGQLLTVNAMLWAGLVGWRRRSVALAALSGVALTLGLLLGLIHLWVALAAGGAVAWHALRTREPLAPLLLRTFLPAVAGAIGAVALVFALTGWNPVTGLLAVNRSFARVQPTIAVYHRLWLLLGLPIFLLFTSPAFWTVGLLNARRILHGSGFGRRLLICTLLSMAATYVIGVPYELPRLWVAFLPPLALGAMIDLPMFHAPGARRVWRPMATIVAVQIAFTALHWTVWDVRESEYRLISERLWN